MPAPRLVLATANAGKVDEFRLLLAGLGVELLSLADLPPRPACPEEGDTYEENAVRKAVYTSGATPHLTIADDSGLEVDALDGAPGVRSARFAGAAAGSVEKCARLLERLDGVPGESRNAAFHCVIALAYGGRVVRTFHGLCPGRITLRPAGAGGFGFDPVFFFPPAGRTLAELDPEEKNRVSHRGRALALLREYLCGDGASLLVGPD